MNKRLFANQFLVHFQCPPCQAFTPVLSEVYKQINKEEKRFEIVFVSSDQNEEAFKGYFAEMPFLALPYDSELRDYLSDYFEVEGNSSRNICLNFYLICIA